MFLDNATAPGRLNTLAPHLFCRTLTRFALSQEGRWQAAWYPAASISTKCAYISMRTVAIECFGTCGIPLVQCEA